ncbi:hypothetical protein GYMLUDRAFT_60898 [Collybiopsis luxurians FD-317 M1]|uniref:Protein kinase domain-containing protein n=1 Tax=Collybiopsis luxurians FD-317 M1 TaxID=944289 RepID=A0A0D0CIC5_9AGAR|nr:hypothetical protein GYMLUDRAFT_60898 [Collybiopsis luxurians FD-317 M1]
MLANSIRPVLPKVARQSSSYAPNHWLKPVETYYAVGGKLNITLSKSKEIVTTQIKQAFLPFTNSALLVVELPPISHLPRLCVLKLFDRRYLTTRGVFERDLWTEEVETDFQEQIHDYIGRYSSTPECDLLTRGGLVHDNPPRWHDELLFWSESQKAFHKECDAYAHLSEAQATGLVPRFYDSVRLPMMFDASLHSSVSHIDGILIEYIPGRTMASFKKGELSCEAAESVSQRVLEMGRRLRRIGVLHSDIHLNNILLRQTDNSPVLLDWALAECRYVTAPLAERWSKGHWDFNKDLRLCLMGYGEDDSSKLKWRLMETPLSDAQRIQWALNWGDDGYQRQNNRIGELPEEVRKHFYYEDQSVNSAEGLRWRIKSGIRSRLHDDPVPSE